MRIAVVVTARPSWAKLQTLCEALRARPGVDLQIVACGSALLERYGKVVDIITAQGFSIAAQVWSTYEGATHLTSAKATGALAGELSAVLAHLGSDLVVVCADRHEVLGAAQAASYSHRPLVHLQGGETTGSIDEKVRHAITQLADYHFVCTELAKFRVYGLTGAADRIWNLGCPSIDLAKRAQREPPVTPREVGGAGYPVNLAQPFAVVLQHPVTSEADQAGEQMRTTLQAIPPELPALVWWPGEDAGADAMSKVIRQHAETHLIHTVRNLPPARFLRLLTQASVLVGNSSAGIRESAYLGVPVVNVGTRQWGRQRGRNVVDVPHDCAQVKTAIYRQVQHGPYASDLLYGCGDSGERIAEVLCRL